MTKILEIPYYDWQAKLETGKKWTAQEVEAMFKVLLEKDEIIAQLEKELAAKYYNKSLDEALNSGDGTYRP